MKKHMALRAISILALGSLASACAYTAPVTVAPNLNVYSSYGSKIPGKFLVYVEDDGFSSQVHATGIACAAHKYPLDLRSTFKESVVGTLKQLVDDVQVVDQPLSADQLAGQGAKGMVIVKGDEMNARFTVIPGFWSNSIDSNVDLSASISVDGIGGRLLGTEAEGSGNAQGPAGTYCAGAAQVIADATEKAMKRVLGELGERFSNSPRIRGTATASR